MVVQTINVDFQRTDMCGDTLTDRYERQEKNVEYLFPTLNRCN